MGPLFSKCFIVLPNIKQERFSWFAIKALATTAMAAAVPAPIAGIDVRAPLSNTHAVKILK